MKGRYIGENIRLILETIDITDENNLPGMIFFSDFEKAFDSINHEYMFKCLRQNKQNKKVPNMHVFKYYLSNRIKIEK